MAEAIMAERIAQKGGMIFKKGYLYDIGADGYIWRARFSMRTKTFITEWERRPDLPCPYKGTIDYRLAGKRERDGEAGT